MLTVLKRYLPHIIVASALVSIMGAAYASVVLSSSSQLHVAWSPNPVTIQVSPVTGHGSAVVQLTCSQFANDLVLTPSSQNSAVTLSVTPSTIPICTTTPITITIIATCHASQEQQCSEGKIFQGEVTVTQPYNNYYYGGQEINDSLKVKVVIVAPQPGFTLSSNPAGLTCSVDQTVTSTITVTPTNGFNGVTTLSTSVLPSGITATISPKNIHAPGSATLTVNCSKAGTFNVEVRGVSNYLSLGLTIPVTVTTGMTPSFNITAGVSSLTCVQGSTATSSLTITAVNGFSGIIQLSANALPNGITGSITPNTVTGSGPATLTIQCTTVGSFNVQVKAQSGDLLQGVTMPVTVTLAPGSNADFTITSSPASITADKTGTSTITITGVGSFTGPVSLAASTSSNGLACTLTPNSISILTGGSTGVSTLSCNSSNTGTFTVTVTGTGGGKSHNVNIQFTAQGEVSAASNSPSMFGFDPTIFYVILGVAAAGIIGSVVFYAKRRAR